VGKDVEDRRGVEKPGRAGAKKLAKRKRAGCVR